MKDLVFKNITEFNAFAGGEEPENSLFSISHVENDLSEVENCDNSNESISLTCGFYNISLKNIISGELLYGRTKYDCSSGTLLLTAPNQRLVFKGLAFSTEAYHIAFHKDYLNGYPLFEKIKKYNFFNYNINEALHLSPKEEELLKSIFKNIQTEYFNNQDEFSKDLIISQLETLLKYTDRFYKRQFLNRQELSNDLLEKFNHNLNRYFESGKLEETGIPSIEMLAEDLSVSQRYLSDMLKRQTGKTATEHIQLFLIDEAKNILLQPQKSISEVAYALGFEYPQYFSRLFKKKEGVSPSEFREKFRMN